jgi:adenylate cyclase
MLMAIFNGHGDQPEHPRAAVQAALEMQAAFANPQPNLSEGMPFLLQFGVGVNTGMAVVGYLGYQTRFEYTAIGENVNLAARLCGLARSGEALATEQTQARAAGLRFAPLQSARLKGFRASIRMSEALP